MKLMTQENVAKMRVFTQNTLVPIAWVLAIIVPTLAVGMLFQQVQQIGKVVDELKDEVKNLARTQSTTFYTDYDSVKDFCTKFIRILP
jgi:hypothetical protein